MTPISELDTRATMELRLASGPTLDEAGFLDTHVILAVPRPTLEEIHVYMTGLESEGLDVSICPSPRPCAGERGAPPDWRIGKRYVTFATTGKMYRNQTCEYHRVGPDSVFSYTRTCLKEIGYKLRDYELWMAIAVANEWEICLDDIVPARTALMSWVDANPIWQRPAEGEEP